MSHPFRAWRTDRCRQKMSRDQPMQDVLRYLRASLSYDKDETPILTKDPKLQGQGRQGRADSSRDRAPTLCGVWQPRVANRQILEYTMADDGPQLAMLVLQDAPTENTPTGRQGLPTA